MIEKDCGGIGPLMLDLEGLALSEAERALLRRPMVGGVILFARNFASVDQLQALTADIRSINPQLLLAVDQEGGRVQRFREGFTRLPAMASLGKLYQRDAEQAVALARECGWLLGSELWACGIDLSFTPVLDLDYGCSSVIGDRSFSASADEVVVLAGALMEGLHEAGLPAVGKHFPGHGGVAADSHLELPVDDRAYADIEAADLVPFGKMMKAGLDAVMPAHVRYSRCDVHPAGFSHFWLQEVLRGRMGFDGVIFSDDLAMAGAEVAGGFAARADAALEAGCDMLLVCNHRPGALAVLEFLEGRQQSGPGPLSRIRRPQVQVGWQQLTGAPRYQEAKRRLEALHQ